MGLGDFRAKAGFMALLAAVGAAPAYADDCRVPSSAPDPSIIEGASPALQRLSGTLHAHPDDPACTQDPLDPYEPRQRARAVPSKASASIPDT